ncbi:MAG: dienelactone hydrolase family protein [Planctomycetaceae bacterium]
MSSLMLRRMPALILLVYAAPALAADVDPVKQRLDNSPRHHEWQEIKTAAGRTVRTFVVFPETKEPAAAVVVIHENKGLTDWVRGVADQLAEAGFVAIAPDFLSQTGPGGGATDAYPSIDAATQGIYKLDPKQVLEDLDAAVDFAKGLKSANGKVAVAGFCWGGGKSFEAAAHNSRISAAFVFYGSAPNEATLGKIAVPVHGFYGENDNRITGQVPAVTEQMKKLKKTYSPIVYSDAGHGFMRTGETAKADDPNRKARDEAWATFKELLKKL